MTLEITISIHRLPYSSAAANSSGVICRDILSLGTLSTDTRQSIRHLPSPAGVVGTGSDWWRSTAAVTVIGMQNLVYVPGTIRTGYAYFPGFIE
jgi:hypothetical protein